MNACSAHARTRTAFGQKQPLPQGKCEIAGNGERVLSGKWMIHSLNRAELVGFAVAHTKNQVAGSLGVAAAKPCGSFATQNQNGRITQHNAMQTQTNTNETRQHPSEHFGK
jgi:hypothetical protein